MSGGEYVQGECPDLVSVKLTLLLIGRRASSGRCLSLTMTLDSGQLVDIVTVYFPCFSSSVEYSAELNECLSFIEDVCTNGHNVILLGDMNFECILSNAGFRQCENVLCLRFSFFLTLCAL